MTTKTIAQIKLAKVGFDRGWFIFFEGKTVGPFESQYEARCEAVRRGWM